MRVRFLDENLLVMAVVIEVRHSAASDKQRGRHQRPDQDGQQTPGSWLAQ
jgi:hypothetical protein